MSNCNCHTEIIRDGSGQLSRYLKALDPSYVHIDDRNIDDLLVFAKRYAAQIRFYDIPGSGMNVYEDETKISWREFFRRDMAVVIASIGLIDIKQIKTDYEELRVKVDQHAGSSVFADLFKPVIGMAARIDKWYSLAIPENPLHDDLDLAIASNLKKQLQKLREYENGFLSVDPYQPLQLDYSSIGNETLWGLDAHAGTDPSIYQGTGTEDRIRSGALFVDDVFHAFYGFIVHLIEKSGIYLEYALEKYPAHQPHMALFIAFLRLFKAAQDQMNGLTERMLSFYYRDVLNLTEMGSIPDRAYIVFELAKDVLNYDVAEGTALKAGKDSSGREQVYKTAGDLVVNEAKVKELKTIFIDKTAGTNPVLGNIYARPVANSADGFGEKFIDPSGKWPTFGKGAPRPSAVKNICQAIDQYTELADRKDQAQIGFAIASPQLVLQGGNRWIRCRLGGLGKLVGEKNLSIWLTTEEGWTLIDISDQRLPGIIKEGKFQVPDDITESRYFLSGDQENSLLYIFLPISEKAVIPFDPKLHKEFFFPTTYPVMQIMVGPDIGLDNDSFNALQCDNISIEVQVGSINPFTENVDDTEAFLPNMDGLTRLLIKTDEGLVTPGTPFDLFTSLPQQGNSFYINSDEVFNKPVYELSINIDLLSSLKAEDGENELEHFGNNVSRVAGFLEVSVLTKGRWTILPRNEKTNSFAIGELTQNVLEKNETKLLADRLPILYNEDITDNSYKGFINIRNLIPFLRKTSKTNLFELLQALAKLLKTRKISLSYHSRLESLDSNTDQVFHVYPFGVVETYLGRQATQFVRDEFRRLPQRRLRKAYPLLRKPEFVELDQEKEYLLVDAKQKLLPQFTYTSPYSKYKAGTVDIRSYRRLLGNANIDWNAEIVPKMIEASGLKEKAEGEISQYSGKLQEEGMLFIGLEKLKPQQTISLLFQFAEGSAEDEDGDPPPIHWAYLVNNEWRPLKDEHIISDGTDGFRATGIIKIDVPADASSHNTIMTDGLIWFCASVTKDSNRIPMLIDVRAQAVEVKFIDNNNAQSHFDAALPAGKISKLAVAVAEIGKVEQPFTSFDGKHKEIGKEFYTRVSERLRHKGRAITAWDYEHLILNRFPSIYKVKAITHTDPNCFCRDKLATGGRVSKIFPKTVLVNGDINSMADALNAITKELTQNPLITITLIGHGLNGRDNVKFVYTQLTDAGLPFLRKIDPQRIETKTLRDGDGLAVDIVESETETCCGPQVAPGHVLIIPIADLKNRNAVNPLQPKTSRRTMLEIEKYIKARTSPFVKLHVRNPLYEQVLVYFKVKFYQGIDKGYFLKKLNEEIVHYLTPWAFDSNAEVKFGQKVYASSVINFIEERPYVDFIVDFLMFVCRDECCPRPKVKDGDYLSAIINMKVSTSDPIAITGNLKIMDSRIPVTELVMVEKGIPDNHATIAENGDFSLTLKGSGGEKHIVLWIQGYQTQEIKAESVNDLGIKFEKQRDPEGATGDGPPHFEKGCGCSEIEYILDNASFTGETVAKPATPRSILVSVPQHIIIPFEETPKPSPCEERRSKRVQTAIDSRPDEPIVVVKKAVPKKRIKKSRSVKKK